MFLSLTCFLWSKQSSTGTMRGVHGFIMSIMGMSLMFAFLTDIAFVIFLLRI